MSSAFQNRLVGIVVIAALAVIILPDLLNSKKVSQEGEFTVIPLRPGIDKDPQIVEQLQQLEDEFEAPQQQVTEVVNADKGTDSSDSTTETDGQQSQSKQDVAAQTEIAWTIQLGSFKSVDNVNNLVASLKQRQFKVYTLPLVPVDGQWNKVFVGPNIDRNKLEPYLDVLAKDFSTKPIIVAYQPELVR
ncbi:SPOR domain-containing protein [Paraferrimonas sp. SM1919]|uniref:SPOR domain-containing protein n=1 Tax=Paraferrimonas sp. SM1919 TaxID=2662263 RepID=UPI0013D31FEE|nr:SPOR domain-containing protein [Paraferrimonas sp. SM1919]